MLEQLKKPGEARFFFASSTVFDATLDRKLFTYPKQEPLSYPDHISNARITLMPRQVLEFRIVVASPAELYDTRRAVFDVIHELNRTLESQGISIRGVGWEEYATPGIGSEVQEVVSQQILREYDILIALLATRLGTPTEKHRSGTVEEIEHAIANTSNPMGLYRVQVYFRDRIESVSSISIDEFSKLTEFRKQLEPRGILYKLFKNDDELQREVRVNIQRPIQEYLRSNGYVASTPQATPKNSDTSPKDTPSATESAVAIDDFGILDRAAEAENAIESTGKSITRITELMQEIATETDKQVAAIENRLISNASSAEKRSFINHFAEFLKSKAIALDQEAKTARGSFNLFANSIVALAGLQRESQGSEQYRSELATFLNVAEMMLNTVIENRTSVAGFRTAVVNIPRITIQFNQAKKLLLDAIDECQTFFDEVERGIFEITAKT
ncbi:hypothetical protein [Bradyrhizobium sp. 23AC]